MKTIPIITFFLCTVMYAHAQLNIVPKNDGLKEYTVTNAHPYDSLTNVEKRSFTSLPGQTLYMHGVKNDRNGYWDAFYTVNFLTGDDRTVYKAVNISTTPFLLSSNPQLSSSASFLRLNVLSSLN